MREGLFTPERFYSYFKRDTASLFLTSCLAMPSKHSCTHTCSEAPLRLFVLHFMPLSILSFFVSPSSIYFSFILAMLSRVINDIYHLKRVHIALPDQVLGETLKNKLLRLPLRNALHHIQQSRSGVMAASADGAASQAASSPPLVESTALSHLLDCLAYFRLGQAEIAVDAMEMVRLSIPFMEVSQLCSTLAACCALGQQYDITTAALPLLSSSLQRSSSPASAAAPPVDGWSPLLFSSGANIILLMEAMQRSRVSDSAVWQLLAEHALRCLDLCDGKQLCRIIEILWQERLTDYPDFFVAAERHVTSQPPGFFTAEQLDQVIRFYKELQQPVMSLVSLARDEAVDSALFDRSLSALLEAGGSAAPAEVHHRLMNSTSAELHSRPQGDRRGAASAAAGLSEQGARGNAIASLPLGLPAMVAFEEAAVAAIATTTDQSLLEMAQKCVRRRVMSAAIMSAMIRRLEAIYITPGIVRRAAVAPASKASTRGPDDLTDAGHSSFAYQRLTQTLLHLVGFNQPALFTPEGARLGQLLDAMGEDMASFYHHRLLRVATGAVTLLPAAAQPRQFYTAIIAMWRRRGDLSTHESPQRLREVLEMLIALSSYGGMEVLDESMSTVAVAVLNTPRSVQLELSAMLANLPTAKVELIPRVYRQWGSQKQWLRSVTETEVDDLLRIMSRSGQRDSALLLAVVEYLRHRTAYLPPSQVVSYMHQLARLGVKDLELYTSTAEQLMRRSVYASAAIAASAAGEHPTTAPRRPQQAITVHDLCLLLFIFTFVIRDTIRVTQQVVARLKMCAGQASPRDISLALFSFVRLRVALHEDVSGSLCDRACAVLPTFSGAELASVWGSLRCLQYAHPRLLKKTVELLKDGEATRQKSLHDGAKKVNSSATTTAAPTVTASSPLVLTNLSDADKVSLISSILQCERRLRQSTAAGTTSSSEALQGRGSRPSRRLRKTSADSAAAFKADGADASAATTATAFHLSRPVQKLFCTACQRLLTASSSDGSQASGQRLYCIVVGLGLLPDLPALPPSIWHRLLVQVHTEAFTLVSGVLHEPPGTCLIEVLDALQRLHAAYGTATPPPPPPSPLPICAKAGLPPQQRNMTWLAPFCPPGLWAAIRPHLHAMMKSPALRDAPELQLLLQNISQKAF